MAVPWPPGVPTTLLRQGFGHTPPDNLLRSDMERGHKQRRTATGTPERVSGALRLKAADYLTFKSFVETDLVSGSLRFDFPHPDTAVSHECRFVAENRIPYSVSRLAAGARLVTFTLEIFPN